MDDSGKTLRELFVDARRRHDDLGNLDPRSDEYKENLKQVTLNYEECRNSISQLALFSPNEEVDDIGTSDLQYLAVDYLLAEILLRSYGDHRQQMLSRALDLLDAFLARLDQYALLSPADRKLYDQFQEDKKSFTLMSGTNVEERRRIKVSRFQEEKALKAKLEHLRDRSKESTVDDETMRKLHLAELALFSSQTFHSLDMVTQENAILSQMHASPPPRQNGSEHDQRSNGRQRDGYSERLDGPLSKPGLGHPGGPLLSKSGKPLQPFTLTDKRIQLQQGVFRPSHNLPTMSIDEYLEEEKRRGGIIDSESTSNTQAVELDEDNMDHVDAQTMKAREWDEFVEANPKGAGNTLNRG